MSTRQKERARQAQEARRLSIEKLPGLWAALVKLRRDSGLEVRFHEGRMQTAHVDAIGHGLLHMTTVRAWERNGWAKRNPDPNDFYIALTDAETLEEAGNYYEGLREE